MAIAGDEGRCVLFRGLSEWCTSHRGRTMTEAAFLIKRTPAVPDCLMRTLIAIFATEQVALRPRRKCHIIICGVCLRVEAGSCLLGSEGQTSLPGRGPSQPSQGPTAVEELEAHDTSFLTRGCPSQAEGIRIGQCVVAARGRNAFSDASPCLKPLPYGPVGI